MSAGKKVFTQPVKAGPERDALIAKVGVMYAEGMSLRAIGEVVGKSYSAVRALVTESGVPMRPHGQGSRGGWHARAAL